MKVNFDTEFKTLKGQPLLGPEKDENGNPMVMTLAYVSESSLIAPKQNTGPEHFKRYKLASKVYAGGIQDLKSEEIVMLKEAIAEAYNSCLINGPAQILLEGEEDNGAT